MKLAKKKKDLTGKTNENLEKGTIAVESFKPVKTSIEDETLIGRKSKPHMY